MITIEKLADEIGQIIIRIETNMVSMKRRQLSDAPIWELASLIEQDLEKLKLVKVNLLQEVGKANQFQINVIANRANTYSDGGERKAAGEVGRSLFPQSADAIIEAICNHPINTRWEEYRVASHEDKQKFLLPEA